MPTASRPSSRTSPVLAAKQNGMSAIAPPPSRTRQLVGRCLQQHCGTPSRGISTHARCEPLETVREQATRGCSLGVPTWLGGDLALAWCAPGRPARRPYQWRRHFLCAQAPEQRSSTPSTPDLSRGRPRESKRWGEVHSGCPCGVVRPFPWHDTLLAVGGGLRTRLMLG